VNEPDTDQISGAASATIATDGEQDNFSHNPDERSEERRLHLQAFDYWHALKASRSYPLFSELRAEDLAPFKTHSLLLEFNQNGTAVRFLGDAISAVVDAPFTVGSYLAEYPTSSFARALLDQFSDEKARSRAAEFEFIEAQLSCRGMMLPFSRDGSGAHFVMVVASFRKHVDISAPLSEADLNTDALNGLLSEGQHAADTIVHMDNGNRASLYKALAGALALYEGAEANPVAYAGLLKSAGLKSQARAPFTPALKLVFGADYDKTRLTEYATATAYAVRKGETSETLQGFLMAMPGGIKGCVQRERMFKHKEAGTSAHTRQQQAVAILKDRPTIELTDITPADEYCLVLARRESGGGVVALGCPDVSKLTLDAAIRQLASSPKQVKPKDR
jgi:hypothetical protein